MSRPIFISGPPRTGTSLTARILSEHGVWTGKCIGPDEHNEAGYYENWDMVNILRDLLKRNGTPSRADSYPPKRWAYRPDLRSLMLQAAAGAGDGPWLFKDSKLLIAYNLFCEAFPEAIWILTRRDISDNLKSLLNHKVWKRRYANVADAEKELKRMIYRLYLLQDEVEIRAEVYWFCPEFFITNGKQEVARLVESCGLRYDEKAHKRAVDKELWHHGSRRDID